MQPPIDDREGEGVAMPEYKHCGHEEQAIYRARDGGELRACVAGLLEGDGEEQTRLHSRAVPFTPAIEQELLAAAGNSVDFVVGELEEEVNGLPVEEKGLVGVEFPALLERGEKIGGGVRGEGEALRYCGSRVTQKG